MTIDLSYAEIGAIVSALQECNSSASSECKLAQDLVDLVYMEMKNLPLGDEIFAQWIDEFEIIE